MIRLDRAWLFSLPIGALCLCLPALWNGFPFLFPDSLGYLEHGVSAYRALWGDGQSFFGGRSICYGLSILPLHGNGFTLWPVIYAQALAVSWLVALCSFRAGLRPAAFLVGMLILGILSSAGWSASYLLPDILANVTILGCYWLTLGTGYLGRASRLGILLLLCWSVTAHGSHLLLALGMLAGLALLGRVRQIGWALAAVCLALFLQCTVHFCLYHRLTVFGNPPPFLLARLLEDGPMLKFLKDSGQSEGFVLADYVELIKPSADHFLWAPDGVWTRLRQRPRERERVLEQQNRLILSTLRRYPSWQLAASARNLACQSVSVGLANYGPFHYVEDNWSKVAPQLVPEYLSSRQFHGRLDGQAVAWCHRLVVILGLLILAWGWRSGRSEWRQLTVFILVATVQNAAICGCLSGVHDRYQARVAWLVPLLAGLRLGRGRSEESQPGDCSVNPEGSAKLLTPAPSSSRAEK